MILLQIIVNKNSNLEILAPLSGEHATSWLPSEPICYPTPSSLMTIIFFSTWQIRIMIFFPQLYKLPLATYNITCSYWVMVLGAEQYHFLTLFVRYLGESYPKLTLQTDSSRSYESVKLYYVSLSKFKSFVKKVSFPSMAGRRTSDLLYFLILIEHRIGPPG